MPPQKSIGSIGTLMERLKVCAYHDRSTGPQTRVRLAPILVPAGETRVLKHFQEQMPYGLFVPDIP
jgi:hypothetical protein